MIRQLLTGVAVLSLMTGAAFAQSYSTTTTTVTHGAYAPDMTPVPDPAPVVIAPDPGARVVAGGVGGGMGGAAVGAAIGCLATLPIGCAPGAAAGAAIGGGGGAVIGAAASAPPPAYYPAPGQ